MKLCWIRGALRERLASLKGGKTEETRTLREKRHRSWEDRIEVSHLQAKESQELSATPESRRVREGLPLEPSDRKQSSTSNLSVDL